MSSETQISEERLVDPVCGMTVSSNSEYHTEHEDVIWRFCSAHCLAKFGKDPDRYLNPPEERQEDVSSGAREYICPMHPEVVKNGPGSCPICGMALEPRTISLEDEENPELDEMNRRFRVSAVLSVPLVVIAMSEMVPGFDPSDFASGSVLVWLQMILATPVVLWGGWPFFVRAVDSLRTRNLNMFTLIGLGVSVAYVYSVVATAAPGIFPATFRGETGQVAVSYEAAAVIVTLESDQYSH
jgi:Cu+-exporting ATPase